MSNLHLVKIIDLLKVSGFAKSNSEAKILLKQKSIKIDGDIVPENCIFIHIPEEGLVMQKGKYKFVKIIL